MKQDFSEDNRINMKISLCRKLSGGYSCFLSLYALELIETDRRGDIIKLYESETVKLKELYTSDLKKDIVAFANANGGTIYIGV